MDLINYIPNLLAFVVVLGILMLVHEWGHFVVARRAGVVVEEFGFGLPPRIFGVERGGVLYSLNWIPFGAFVKMLGEEDSASKGSFASKSKWWQVAILLAGPGMNFLVAGLVFGIAYMTGFPTPSGVAIDTVAAGSPAESSGIRAGDIVVAVNGSAVTSPEEFRAAITRSVGTAASVGLTRSGQPVQVSVTPRINPPPGQGALGVSLKPAEVRPVQYNPIESIALGFWRAIQIVGLTVMAPVMVIQGMASLEMLRPVGLPGMAQATSQAYDAVVNSGYLYPLLMMAGTFSAGLAVANLLPIPALDGGRILFIIIEVIRGKAVSPERQGMVHYVGIVVLITLMVVISLNDIRNPLPTIDWGFR